MKTTIKKRNRITLNRVTVRVLASNDLSLIRGGAIHPSMVDTQNTSKRYTDCCYGSVCD